MIRFLYRAGAAQTKQKLSELIQDDLKNGLDVLLLVPEQQTVSTECRMLRELPPSAQLHFEVVNFSRLANRVFRTVGGHRWNVASPAIRSLVMWRTMRHLAPMLLQYKDQASKERLCDMMLDVSTRLRACCISPDALLRVAEDMDDEYPFRNKLTDLGTVIGVFEAELAKRFDNGDDDLDRLADILTRRGKELFGNTAVYVDSFTDYTGQEIGVLRALMTHCLSVSFTHPLASPHDDGLHLASATRTHRQLKRIANELGAELSIYTPTEASPATAKDYLSQNLFRMAADPAPMGLVTQSNVTLVECEDPFSEAEAAAAEIHRLIREGCRYRDIAVVLRDANANTGILDHVLEREEIPFFLSEKTDITLRPLIKLLLLALRIYTGAWRDEDVVAYLKTGLCDIPADDVNLFEEYVSVWHPRGAKAYAHPFTRNPDGYSPTRSERAERILTAANRARERLVPPLQALFADLEAAKGATEKCRAVYCFLTALGIQQRLREEATAKLLAGERREATELSRLYTVTVDALESLSKALEDEPLTVAEFADAMRLIFSHTDIGSIPTSSDEVTVGSASMLRTEQVRYVLVLGLNEGVFPHNVKDDGLLNDSEKDFLRGFGLDMPSSRAERASDELFYLYRTFSAPSDGLYLSYSRSNTSGGALTPSIAIARVKALLPGLPERCFDAEDALRHIYTPAGAMDRLSELKPNVRKEVAALLCDMQIPAADTLELPVVDPLAQIKEETASSLFANTQFSPSHLERYSACRFSYYCERILKLRDQKSGALALSDTGTFLHYVLERAVPLLQRLLSAKKDGTTAAPKEIDSTTAPESEEEVLQAVREICQRYRLDIEEKSGPLTPRANALMERLGSLSHLIIRSLFKEFSDSQFQVAFTELDLKSIGRSCTLPLQNGKLPLSGKADRLDVWRSPDGEAFVRVVDYKTGTRRFSTEDITHGYSLQMPIYLAALCNRAYPFLNKALGLPTDSVLKPAGVTYFSSAISAKNTPSRIDEEEALLEAEEGLKRSGVLLSDNALLHAASNSANPAILGSTRSKSIGKLSPDGFDSMFAELSKTVERLVCEMRGGNATAHPNLYGKNDPCKTCSYAAVCRTVNLHQAKEDEEHA